MSNGGPVEVNPVHARTNNFGDLFGTDRADSGDRARLETWARETVGGEITLCRTCFGR